MSSSIIPFTPCPNCTYDVQRCEREGCIKARGENPKAVQAAADDKPRLDLLEPEALRQTADVMAHGAAKYGARNFHRTPLRKSTYYGAMLRHLLAWYDGEEFDQDSGKRHMAHISANADIILAVGDKLIDDSREPGGSAEQRQADAVAAACPLPRLSCERCGAKAFEACLRHKRTVNL